MNINTIISLFHYIFLNSLSNIFFIFSRLLRNDDDVSNMYATWNKTSLLRTSMASTSLLICTFFSSFLLFVHCQSQNNCIALSDCRTLFDLLKNRDNFANFTRVDVYKHLKNVNCGFDGRSPLVKCPDLGTK